jgi:hypothetical protein
MLILMVLNSWSNYEEGSRRLLGIVCSCICFARMLFYHISRFNKTKYTDFDTSTNHITAVLSDDLFISSQPTTSPPQYVETRRHAVAENFQQFAARIGFHETMVALLERMAFLYGVVDVFTQKFLPAYRNEFVEKFARC